MEASNKTTINAIGEALWRPIERKEKKYLPAIGRAAANVATLPAAAGGLLAGGATKCVGALIGLFNKDLGAQVKKDDALKAAQIGAGVSSVLTVIPFLAVGLTCIILECQKWKEQKELNQLTNSLSTVEWRNIEVANIKLPGEQEYTDINQVKLEELNDRKEFLEKKIKRQRM